jgi:ABC-type polar amino acid transport system ATPase subunit
MTGIHDAFAAPGALTPAGAEPIVRLEGLEKYFGSNHVLRGCTLEVYPRETICIIGRSGSGKSTLLRCANFLEEPTVGTIEVDGLRVEADPLHAWDREHQERIRQIRLRAQMVFQEFNLFPHMTVLQNLIEGPTRVKGVSEDEAVATAENYLDKVGLREKRDEYPARLSGGQKQRVAIARAIAGSPTMLIGDEPTAALDPTTAREVIELLAAEARQRHATLILSTHRISQVIDHVDRVVGLRAGRLFLDEPAGRLTDDALNELYAGSRERL